MKSLYGKINNIILIVLIIAVFNAEALAADNKIEFILESKNCESETIQSTLGNAYLSASADGINREKIRWDDDVSILAPRMQGKKLAAGWKVGGYWMIEFSAKNLKNLSFSADMFSSGKGPKTFEMYYSINGVDFYKIDNSEVVLSKNNRTVYNNFSLPAAINGESNVYIKIVINSAIGVNGNTITGLKDGSTYINNIIICAEDKNSSGDNNNSEDKEDENQESGEENTKKSYYPLNKNTKTARMGLPTGKYKFSVKISS